MHTSASVRGHGQPEPINGSGDRVSGSGDETDLIGPLTEAAGALTRLARIEWERILAAVKGLRRRALLALWEVLFIGILTITGTIVLVQGITKGFGALLGAEWAGDLAAAVAMLGGALAFAMIRTRRRDKLHHNSLYERLDVKERS